MHSDKNYSAPRLRDTKLCRVEYLRGDPISTLLGKILKNLLANTHLIETGNVFHYKCQRFEFGNNSDKLAIETVPRIINNAAMIPNLGKRLAGGAADYDLCIGSSLE